jgi:hypothetical protein
VPAPEDSADISLFAHPTRFNWKATIVARSVFDMVPQKCAAGIGCSPDSLLRIGLVYLACLSAFFDAVSHSGYVLSGSKRWRERCLIWLQWLAYDPG